jgi:hypothetical protein
MSKAIQLKPFNGRVPPLIHTPRQLLKNAVPTISTALPFLASTTYRPIPSRLMKFRNDQMRVKSLEMRNNQLNWVPIGLSAPKRLGKLLFFI